MTDVVQRADVRMGKLRNRFGLALKALAQGSVRRQIRGQYFDGYFAVQTTIAGAIHLSHTARAQRGLDLIRS
jgi:hypothetical protein